MSLKETNEFLTDVSDVLVEAAIGQTIENKGVRIHRYASSIRVTDLTNAGRRGKMVDQFALYDLDYTKDRETQKAVEQFARMIDHVKDYKTALKMAKGLVAFGQNRKGNLTTPKISESKLKGVRVAPGGFKPIVVESPYLSITADSDSFRVRNKEDTYNEGTLTSSFRGKKKTAVKKFYDWAVKNERRLKSMDFSDVLNALKKNGIDYHQYSAMD